MAWMRLDTTFRMHPKILRLARMLSIRTAEARGLVTGLWTWVTEYAPDGDLSSFDLSAIEEGSFWEGKPGELGDALLACKLIDKSEHGYVVHDWMDFADRLKAAQRKKKQREDKRGTSTGHRRDKKGRSRSRDRDSPINVTEDGRDGRTGRTDGTNDSSEVAPSAPPSRPLVLAEEVFLEYPVVGGAQEFWSLTRSKVAEYKVTFPGVDIESEARKARQWCIDNPRQRKTPQGMTKFIGGWFARVQDSGKKPVQSNGPPKTPERGALPLVIPTKQPPAEIPPGGIPRMRDR